MRNIKLFHSFYFMTAFQISKRGCHASPWTIFLCVPNITTSFSHSLSGIFFQPFAILFLLYKCILNFINIPLELWCLSFCKKNELSKIIFKMLTCFLFPTPSHLLSPFPVLHSILSLSEIFSSLIS